MSTRWDAVAGGTSGDAYAARFDRAATSGADVHGEADLVDSLAEPGSRVLDAGCGTGRVAIELAARGHACVGVDVSESMLRVARERAPGLAWHRQDLAELTLGQSFDVVVAAGNVVPLVASGTEAQVVRRIAEHLGPGGLLVAGFGLDAQHLPLDEAPFGLAAYDRWCADAGLEPVDRWATWDRAPYEGGGYAVSVHRRPPAADVVEG